jgi:hypothetical protein
MGERGCLILGEGLLDSAFHFALRSWCAPEKPRDMTTKCDKSRQNMTSIGLERV